MGVTELSSTTRGSSRPTLEDVANAAGVSRATVSRVINSSPKVSPEVRETVHNAVRKLGYIPNRAARTLVTRRTDAIALVLSEPDNKFFADPYFATVVRGAATELSTLDIQLVLMLADQGEDSGRILRFLSGGHVDGALVLAPHRDDPLPAQIAALPLPSVFGGKPWLPESEVHAVDNDNVAGGRVATEHLLGLGRRTVVSVLGPADEQSARDRLQGWQEATGADAARTEAWTAQGDFTQEGGERAMAELLERVPDLDAVFVGSDLMAVGALHALRAAGKRVPEDVAVVGFDDQPTIAPYTDPPLTSVKQDSAEQMRTMVQRLFELLNGEDVPTGREVLPVELVRRASA
ncbi:LacI family DNA-binding transcriptional regulator [Allokutzneria sp. NRRL B-24872]|uniref:LacI family DNA-binding transcriptional regulator n=1 Tax=Allokutzneria sp. NRRL B-24872 TaxID=1137961 RepID=UPI000A3B7CA1|nr:LacI family DNA-binding transcriptional regulator [Allokutzneria sp. NRRL B-24872]